MFWGKGIIETIDIKLLGQLFPTELMDYFVMSGFQILCRIENKTEFWLIEFEEKNELPNGYTSLDYESKGFTESKSIQDFPLGGKAVYLRIRKRRWRHKKTGEK